MTALPDTCFERSTPRSRRKLRVQLSCQVTLANLAGHPSQCTDQYKLLDSALRRCNAAPDSDV